MRHYAKTWQAVELSSCVVAVLLCSDCLFRLSFRVVGSVSRGAHLPTAPWHQGLMAAGPSSHIEYLVVAGLL